MTTRLPSERELLYANEFINWEFDKEES